MEHNIIYRMTSKNCSRCKVEKLIAEFHNNRGQCKLCRKELDRYYRSRTNEQWEKDTAKREEELRKQHMEGERRRTDKYSCECGAIYYMFDVSSKEQHEQTKKHQNFINGIKKETKDIISYYDEENSFKRKFIKVNTEVYKTFKSNQSRAYAATTSY